MVSFLKTALFVLPWLSAPFLKKKDFIRFSPASFFIAMLLLIEAIFSVPYKLWTVKGGAKEKPLSDIAFIFGPFFIGSIWVLKLTFGKFHLYMLINLIMDYLLAYPISSILQKLKLYKLVNLKPPTLFYISVFLSILMYKYQLIMEKREL